MVGDITYIPTWEGWLFLLATVIDCHTAWHRIGGLPQAT
jgi:transposase InsO family protein